MMFRIIFLVAFAVLGFSISSFAETQKYGAIAVSDSTLGAGYSTGYDNQIDAEVEAEMQCEQTEARPDDCESVMWFYNNCGALATSETADLWGTGRADSKAEAEAQALQYCSGGGAKDCVVTASVCSY